MQLNALFCCLWRNVEASCHKHFVVFSGNQHRRLLPAMCHNLRDGGRPPATAFTTPACCSVNTGSQARHRLRIAFRQRLRSANRYQLIRHRRSMFGRRAFSVAGPIEWNSLPDSLRDPARSTDSFRSALKTHLRSATGRLAH